MLEWLHQREHNAKNQAERRFASRIIGQKSEIQRDPSRKREYELNERNPVAKDNYLISIFSAGGYFYLEPRTLQVLFCQFVLNDILVTNEF